MASGRFRRFTKVEKLEEVGRPLLKRLFGLPEYAAAFAQAGVTFPDDVVSDEDYYAGVADLFRRSEALPDKVSDDLHVMDELAGIQEMDDLRERFRAKKHDLPPAARTVMEVIAVFSRSPCPAGAARPASPSAPVCGRCFTATGSSSA